MIPSSCAVAMSPADLTRTPVPAALPPLHTGKPLFASAHAGFYKNGQERGRLKLLIGLAPIDRSGTPRRGWPYALACASLLACAVAFATPQHPPETAPNPAQIGGLSLIVETHQRGLNYPGLRDRRARGVKSPLNPRQRIILHGRDPRCSLCLISLSLLSFRVLDFEGLHSLRPTLSENIIEA